MWTARLRTLSPSRLLSFLSVTFHVSVLLISGYVDRTCTGLVCTAHSRSNITWTVNANMDGPRIWTARWRTLSSSLSLFSPSRLVSSLFSLSHFSRIYIEICGSNLHSRDSSVQHIISRGLRTRMDCARLITLSPSLPLCSPLSSLCFTIKKCRSNLHSWNPSVLHIVGHNITWTVHTNVDGQVEDTV